MKTKHNKFQKLEVSILISLLLVGALTFFSYPGLTGHVSSDLSTQIVDFLVDQSQVFEISTDSGQFYIKSLRLSGEIIGEGVAEIWLDNSEGQRLLVFSNIREKDSGISSLTGITAKAVAVGDEIKEDPVFEKKITLTASDYLNTGPATQIAKGQETFNGAFESECIDTCFIKMRMNKELRYNLIFRLESGTEIRLTKIQYTAE